MPRFAFMDTETTGLHAARKPWDVALIIRDCDDHDYGKLNCGIERHQFFVHPADLDWLTVQPKALEIGGFWGRHPHAPILLRALEELATDITAPWELRDHPILRQLPNRIGVARLADVAATVHRRTRNKSLICGSNPHFDMETMAPTIEAVGLRPEWHYHPVDIPSMCEGFLHASPRLRMPDERKSDQLAAAVGVELKLYDRHTALGDCELFYAAWKAIVGL